MKTTKLLLTFALTLAACGDGVMPLPQTKGDYMEPVVTAWCDATYTCNDDRPFAKQTWDECYTDNMQDVCLVVDCAAEVDNGVADQLLVDCLQALDTQNCQDSSPDACLSLIYL